MTHDKCNSINTLHDVVLCWPELLGGPDLAILIYSNYRSKAFFDEVTSTHPDLLKTIRWDDKLGVIVPIFPQ